MLRILNTGRQTASSNMLRDASLLEELDPKGLPILHLYEWDKPSITYGYFIEPEKLLNLPAIQKRGIDLARRPTGGGIVFHIWDFAFSFLMPSGHPAFSLNTLENYRFVNEAVLGTVKEEAEIIPESFQTASLNCVHFCMARPTQYDVVYQGRKIAGAAQRRRKQGYLHQGTISLAMPDRSLLKEVLLSEEAVIDAMIAYSFQIKRPDARGWIQKLLTEKLEEKLCSSDDEHAKKAKDRDHADSR